MTTTGDGVREPGVRETEVPAPHEEPRGWGIAGVTVVSLAAAFAVVWGISQHAAMVMPAFLALNLVIAAQPLQRRLERAGLPRWGGMIIVLLVLYLLLAALVGMLVWALWIAAEEIPQYQGRFVELYGQTIEFLGRFGVSQDQVSSSLAGVDPGTIIGTVQNVAGQVSSAGGQLTVLVIALTFLVFDVPGVTRRRAVIVRQRPRLADALSSFTDGVKSYWIVSTIFGLLVAIIDTVALMIIGVPLAVVWGVLAFVTNYIPNIGFVLGLVPPALFALLTGGPVDAIWVVVIYCVVNLVIQSFIQPKFTGDAVGLTPTVTFLSLVFWTSVAGALGAILAVPLTLVVKAFLVDADPRMRWLSTFLTTPDADARRDRRRVSRRDRPRRGPLRQEPG
ncbi:MULTISPECIES: AI-2E family transporter [unclassified Dietzia]|uniref:AI-2E family transporter n=1 Tax=unclassified Dietzia TaxID=2617939 RepID=UPI0015FD8FFE|nr:MULTISPECIES: AI-2E family transporter [unclassified Dietzia]MBB1023740.1 AI-2E family transporter [Dietzia sp. DQ12-76]MBB1028586.1 AI-2E family transporter [Dietzia sp. DQ11-38-2]